MATYRQRSVDRIIDALFAELPALLLVGPRATGKTTTASRHVTTTVKLDDEVQAAAYEAGPDAALRGLREPVLLDEWQMVPKILGAVKRALDVDYSPGRYLLTGSVRADLDAPTWPGTGRLVRLPMYGMTVAEQRNGPTEIPFLQRLVEIEQLAVPPDPPDLRGYIEVALMSGFPEAVSLSTGAREAWIESYIDQILTRDAERVAEVRNPGLLKRYFEAYALNSAGVVQDKIIYDAAGVNRRTASAYEQLLVNLRVVDQLPAWTTNRLKRLTRMPKRFLVDPALVAGALLLDEDGILADGNLLGRILETFVMAQLRAELPLSRRGPHLFHLREDDGRREIDVVAELAGRRVAGIEVKAAGAPRPTDWRHLAWLRDELGVRFVRGVVLHTGPRLYEVDDRIVAAPIATLWG